MQQPRRVAKAIETAYAPLITALELQAAYIKILEKQLKWLQNGKTSMGGYVPETVKREKKWTLTNNA